MNNRDMIKELKTVTERNDLVIAHLMEQSEKIEKLINLLQEEARDVGTDITQQRQ